jgi:hypothetical protein
MQRLGRRRSMCALLLCWRGYARRKRQWREERQAGWRRLRARQALRRMFHWSREQRRLRCGRAFHAWCQWFERKHHLRGLTRQFRLMRSVQQLRRLSDARQKINRVRRNQ